MTQTSSWERHSRLRAGAVLAAFVVAVAIGWLSVYALVKLAEAVVSW